MEYAQFLVETDWLAEHQADPHLRLFDCTFFLARPRPATGDAQTPGTGAELYWSGHIPGAAYIDLRRSLSTNAAHQLSFPAAERVAAPMTALGVHADTQVVLYDAQGGMWATRVWWILRAYGFDRAAVLNGGYRKWAAEDRPATTEPATARVGRFDPRPRPQMIATTAEVQAAIRDGARCLLNALSPAVYEGADAPYGRPGHIPSSLNLPAAATVDGRTGAYLPDAALRELFTNAGATAAGRVITYCGGGIAASVDAFLLTRLGVHNVAIYDGSLTEWCADSSLPLVRGPEPG